MAKKLPVKPKPTAEEIKLQKDIFNYLKDNVRISVNNNTDSQYADYGGSGGKYISINTTVELYLKNPENPETQEEFKISSESSSDSFYVDE